VLSLKRLGQLAALLLAILSIQTIPCASAQPQGAHITDIQHVNDRWDKVSVFSPSMNKIVVNDVFKAPKSGAPTFYLLPGIDGGDDLDPGAPIPPGGKSWFGMTDIHGFFADKNVNVVSPLGGPFSWYTDWVNDGSKQYQTYMTKELPPLINAQYKANGRNAVGGLSSTGGTAIDYAVQAPGVYRAVGSYRGFPSVSHPDEMQDISLTLSGGGVSAEAMWGPLGSPLWVAHDPTKNVAKLKGVAVYAAEACSTATV
jgi:S-formylglutathione hydrolase FrmB